GPAHALLSRELHRANDPLPRLQVGRSLQGPPGARGGRRELRLRHRGGDGAGLALHRHQHAARLPLRAQVHVRASFGRPLRQAPAHPAKGPGAARGAPAPPVHGGAERYGLVKPDHPFMSSHPVVNSELLYFIRHGRIHPRPDIARFEGDAVHFVDGRIESYETIIAATGFKISFPFFDRSLVDFSSGEVPLYLRVFHRQLRDVYFIGLFQPIGCIWPPADLQARLVANHIVGNYRLPADMDRRIASEVDTIRHTFTQTPRHTIEVDYHPF